MVQSDLQSYHEVFFFEHLLNYKIQSNKLFEKNQNTDHYTVHQRQQLIPVQKENL